LPRLHCTRKRPFGAAFYRAKCGKKQYDAFAYGVAESDRRIAEYYSYDARYRVGAQQQRQVTERELNGPAVDPVLALETTAIQKRCHFLLP